MFDPISIGVMLLGSALQAKAQQDALAKQQRLAVESRQRALQAQNQATDVAMRQVQEYDPATRKAKQDEIQTQLTDQFQQAAAGTPITAQFSTAGWALIALSTSAENTLKPPVMIMSFLRSTM